MAKEKKLSKSRNNGAKNVRRFNEITLAAAQVFAQKGFASASLDDVADVLDITKAALYYYVESKQELLFSIMVAGMEILDSEVITPARQIVDPETRLKFIVTNHARLLTGSSFYMAVVTTHDLADLDAEQQKEINNRYRNYFDFLRGTLGELKGQGKLYEMHLTVATLTILGMITWITKWYVPGGRISSEEVSEQICDMALRSVIAQTKQKKSPVRELAAAVKVKRKSS